MRNTTRRCRIYATVDGIPVHYEQEMDMFEASRLLNNKERATRLVQLRYPSAKKIEHATVVF